jgi:hypothetical protein
MAIVPCFSVRADGSPEVTIQNYVRAETDLQMRNYVENMDAFGKFAHVREAYDVPSRDTIRPNRDTLYSWSVFDVTSPLTIGLPDPGDRYQSLMIVSQDHSIWSEYGPKEVVLDQETVGTRYALLLLRTFLDPNDEEDVKAAHALQDAVTVKQADKGTFEYPGWNKEEVEAMREKINVVAALLPENTKTFGRKEDLPGGPVHRFGFELIGPGRTRDRQRGTLRHGGNRRSIRPGRSERRRGQPFLPSA